MYHQDYLQIRVPFPIQECCFFYMKNYVISNEQNIFVFPINENLSTSPRTKKPIQSNFEIKILAIFDLKYLYTHNNLIWRLEIKYLHKVGCEAQLLIEMKGSLVALTFNSLYWSILELMASYLGASSIVLGLYAKLALVSCLAFRA